MGTRNRAGGLNASRCRATGHTFGGRQRATTCPVSHWFHHSVSLGRIPVESPKCWVKVLAMASAETVLTQLAPPSKPLSNIVSA